MRYEQQIGKEERREKNKLLKCTAENQYLNQ